MHSRHRAAALTRLGVLGVCLLSLALLSCDTFDFYGLISGTETHDTTGGPLAVSPLTATVIVNGTCTFTASGGTPPYRFSIVSGSGTINAETGVYTAPAAPSSDPIQVGDAAGGTAEARAVTVQ